MLQTLFDGMLATMLVMLSARLLFSRDLYAAAVLYVAFGLAMAVVWVRLAAPDVALAEAAVGAGLTGALLLRAVGQMPSGGRLVPLRLLTTVTVSALAAMLGAALLAVLLTRPLPGPGSARAVRAAAAGLDLEQPVTALLLVFRGFDTLLELTVLLITVLAVLAARPAVGIAARRLSNGPDELLLAFARLLLPVALVIAGFTVWQGTGAPGGAFQGGAVMAAALVLGFLAGLRVFTPLAGVVFRLVTALAIALPLLLTLPRLVGGSALFSYPDGDPGRWILGLEIAIAVSVAFILAALFAGAEPVGPQGRSPAADATTEGE